MNKAAMRFLGVFLIIGGILIVAISFIAKEETKPQKVSYGAVIDGEYIEVGSGHIGGSELAKDDEDMGSLVGMGVVVVALGIVAVVAGNSNKESEYDDDY